MFHRKAEHTNKHSTPALHQPQLRSDVIDVTISSMPCATVVESVEETITTKSSDSVNVILDSIDNNAGADARAVAVSYTHLTLPTT